MLILFAENSLSKKIVNSHPFIWKRNYHLKVKVDPKISFAKRLVFNETVPQFKLELHNRLPVIREGEILAKIKSATICLSDIHTICGARKEPVPSVLGHEACVEVIESRRKVVKPGDRITFSIADSCGTCEFCLNNLNQKCKNLFKYGHASVNNGTGFNGCYASHIVIRAGTHVIKLPDEIGDDIAATINCALSTMVNCVDQIPKPIINNKKSKFLIQGNGMLGLYGCALLSNMGFKEIYCVGNTKSRSDLVTSFGAIPIENENQLESEHNQIDCVIEACGNSAALVSGMNVLKPGGAYLLVGMVHPNTSLKITGEQIVRKCMSIIGVHNYQNKHLDQAVRFLRDACVEFPFERALAPTKFPLENVQEAIELAKKKDFPRVCLKP